jgi:hypothetical protein
MQAGKLKKGFGHAVPVLMKIVPHYRINRVGWDEWDEVTKPMPTEDVVDLARGLALADTGGLYLGGSIEPIYNPVSAVEIAIEKGANSILVPITA